VKVLHIIDSGGLYGAEMVLLNLAAEQIKQGLEPIIASIGEKGVEEKALETEAIRRGFRVEKFRMTPGPNYLGALKILKFARKEDVDILHSHGYKGNILFGLMPKKIRRIPLVATIHGYTSTGNGFSRMRVYESLDSKALRFMDAVVFVSNAMKLDPRFKHLNHSRVHVIHNGIPIDSHSAPSHPHTFAPSDAADLDQHILSFCRHGFTLGSIGRLSPEKGYTYLIDALKIIREKGHDVRLVIIGEGGERNSLEKKIKELDLESYVMLPGYKESASSYLTYFDIFVLPSLTEGLPMTILEAIRIGLPIIATNVGGIPEILGNEDLGILVPRRNHKELAQAIIFWKTHYKREKLAQNSEKRFMKRYSSRLMAKRYSSLYKHATGS